MGENTAAQKRKVLFCSNFMISAFTFGGGGVIIPMLRKKYVEDLGWINEDEMMDMIAIAQSSPGIMAVNTAIIIGYQAAGVSGALCAILGSILPPMIILSAISYAYDAFASNTLIALALRGMEAGVAAVMIHVAAGMSAGVIRHKNRRNTALLAAAAVLAVCFQVSIVRLIIGCVCISAGAVWWERRRREVTEI